MVVGVINTNGTMNRDDISDYVAANMKDPISRTSGVGDVQLFGSQYAMRIWMDPNKLNNFQLTPVDVISALKAQNARGRGPVRRYAAGERPAA
nr:Acriflavine resistance protein B [Klebsiella pneumoniae]